MAVLADRYELRQPLGSGAMAEVVAALDTRLGRMVAIKLIRQELLADPTSRQRLLREARSAAVLHHPNSVAVYDVGEDSGRPFIVMELVAGQTLADRLQEGGPLTVGETIQVGSALLSALQAAHDRGLVHRDVKPANVLLATSGTVKLADFGIAKALDATDAGLTSTGLIIGTPRYLAPEVAAGLQATFASDLYSLSAVLFECLAGSPPFDGPTPIAVAGAHERAPVPSLTEFAPHVPPSLAEAIERGLSKEPAHRFASAREMQATLNAGAGGAVSGGPVGAPSAGIGGAGTQVLDPEDGSGTELPGAGVTAQAYDPQDAAGNELSGSGVATRAYDAQGDAATPIASRVPVVWIAAAVVLAIILAVWGVAQLLPGADDDGSPAPDAGTEQADAPAEGEAADDADPDGAAPAPREEAPGDATSPEDALDDLIADLARDPDAAGQHGDRLLGALMDIRDEEDVEGRAEDARQLVRDIASWLTRDQIDRSYAEAAVPTLTAIGTPDGEGLDEIAELFSEIALDEEAWGKKAKDLLDDLDDLLGADPEDRSEDAADIIDEIDEWIDKDELDADRGRRAQTILRDL